MGAWKKMFRSILISSTVMMLGISACQTSPSPSAPPRDFNTSDLLIAPSLLRGSWEVESGPNEYHPNAIGFWKNLGGNTINLRSPQSHADHIVVVFPSSRDAARAYLNHDYTRDTVGRFPKTWYELDEFSYDSLVSDQFRVVCVERENLPKLGDSCVIEAQYKEYLSVVLYGNSATERTISDLEMIAKAVDERVVEFLGK